MPCSLASGINLDHKPTATSLSLLSAQVKKRCRWMYDFSKDVLSQLPGSSADPYGGTAIDINALGWAFASVTSRAFRTRGKAYPASCLPLIDMANHSLEPNVEVGGATLSRSPTCMHALHSAPGIQRPAAC